MVLGINIRETDHNFVTQLAESIRSQGQLQDCIGDTRPDGTVRVWAGQHRYRAVSLINEENLSRGEPPVLLRVRKYYKEFTPDQVLGVQLAENLQNHMTPGDEAGAIRSLWDLYQQVFEGEKISVAGFAKKIGRGEDKVRNALAFSGLNEGVQKMVENGVLLYSVAVNVARLPSEQQLRTAVRIVQYNLEHAEADRLIRGLLGEAWELPGLFSGQAAIALDTDNHRIAFKGAADKAAQSAAGYFVRILRLIEILDARERFDMTQTIKDILVSFILSSGRFERLLEEEAPILATEIGIMVRATIEQSTET